MPPFLTLLLRALLAYGVFRLGLQLIGNRQVGQMTLHELIIGIVFASLVGIAALWPLNSLWEILIVAGLWLALFAAERYLLLRNRTVRQSLQGDPAMLIYRGKLLEHNLYRKRLSPEQLLSKLRTQNIFDLADVEMAVLEPDGLLSVLRNPQVEPLTKQDMLVTGKHKGLPTELIVEGEIVHENLENRGLNEKWLRDHLRAFDVEFVHEVVLATVDDNGQLYVDTYKDNMEQNKELHSLAAKPGVRGFADVHPLQEKPKSSIERSLAENQLNQLEKESRPHVPKQEN